MNFFFSVQCYRDIKQIRNNDPTLVRHPRLVGEKNAPSEKYAPMTLRHTQFCLWILVSMTTCESLSQIPVSALSQQYLLL